MSDELDYRVADPLRAILAVLRTVGLDDAEIRRIIGQESEDSAEDALRADARTRMDERGHRNAYRRDPGALAAEFLRESSIGIDLPREFTHVQASEAFTGAIRANGCDVSVESADGGSVDVEAHRPGALVFDHDGLTSRFRYPVGQGREERFVALAVYLDIFLRKSREYNVVRLRTGDDRFSAAVVPSWSYDALRGESAAVSVEDDVVFAPFRLSEIEPAIPAAEYGESHVRAMHVEYLVPKGDPETEFGSTAHELAAALRRFGPETETIFYHLDDMPGPRSPPVVEHVFERLECRLRTLMAGRHEPPEYGNWIHARRRSAAHSTRRPSSTCCGT